MQTSELHSFFLYVIFGHLLAYAAVALYLKYFARNNPKQHMMLYLLAILTPYVTFLLYHSLLTKQCHTGIFLLNEQTLGFFCHLGYLASIYLSPLLLFFGGAGVLKAAAVPFFIARARRQAVMMPRHEAERVQRILAAQCAALCLSVPEVIYSGKRGFAAFVAGLGKPVLVINARLFTRLTEQEIKAVLTHELVHIKRKDTLFSYLLYLLRNGAFFSPFSSLLLRSYLLENERNCDREASACLGDFHGYSTAMLKVWRLLLEGAEVNPAVLSSGFGTGGREMEWRLISLLQSTQRQEKSRPSYLFYCFAAAMPVSITLLLGLIC